MTEDKGVGLKGWLSGPGRKKPAAQLEAPRNRNKLRIAILPLSNYSPDPQDEYFADGMTEEVISTVSRVEGLEVISRTSVMQYKKAPKPAREVSRELEVGTILEGSVRKAGDKLRVSVQMIDAEKDKHLWSENYDRNLQDIFTIQSDIAKQVAEALEVRLLPNNQKTIEKKPTSSVEAYTFYLKARPHLVSSSKVVFDQAIQYYERAISIDSNFALAYAGLASAYSGLAFHGLIPSRDAVVKSKSYIEKALRIDNSLAEAHWTLGRILRNFDWDIVGADREFRRAIELNPSLTDARCSRAVLSMFRRHRGEAVREVERALELDPLSAYTHSSAGTVYLYVGENDKAIEHFTKALAINPNDEYSQGNLGLSYIRKGMLEKGIEEMEKAASAATTARGDLAYSYAKAGKIPELKNLLDRSLGEVDKNPDLAYAIASAYANLGDRDKAIEWLEKAYNDHVAALIGANGDFVFDTIRDDPRFQELMRKLGYS